jgi:sulfoquinovosidase
MRLIEYTDGFDLVLSGMTLLRHRRSEPLIYVGAGVADVQMNRGHFRISDYLEKRIPLRNATILEVSDGFYVSFASCAMEAPELRMRVSGNGAGAVITFLPFDSPINRFWLRVPAEPTERLWGGGEQLSHFNLRGRRFPLWTSEPGVGRDKSTLLTFQADQDGGSGGDYYNTNYPQPTYLSSRHYALHVETTAYSVFDFQHEQFHEIEVWAIPERIELWVRNTLRALVGALSDRFGRQPPLPEWVLRGAIIGLKDGERSFTRLEAYAAAGVAICGLWCEDWAGIRQTSFGRRLFWDWTWNPQRYPMLKRRIEELAGRGVRFLGYVNPYLCVDGQLYPHAAAAGYLARRADTDEPYIVDFGEFECGIVDFTNSRAAAWFANEVIGANMLDFGLSGWMADFGEYLPTDVRLANGMDGMLAHNAWPTLWAEVNAQAVAGRGKTGDALFFMRAGFTGVQRHCPLLWAGDQSVDFSRHDGLPTVICAALSSGLLGNAYHHSDIGGYTSLYGNVRTAELIQRWAEMAAFTAVMRSHEGNRPAQNLQIDQDPVVLAHFARMTRIYRHLAPYLTSLSQEASQTGLPVQRPLFLHFEDDPRAYDSQTSYLYGADVLVAPVLEASVSTWRTYLPSGVAWVHVWSGIEHAGGSDVEVAAPLGQPPVFYRKDSPYVSLFAALAEL